MTDNDSKAALRLTMRARRRALAADRADAPLRAAAIYEAAPLRGVRTAAVYLPQGAEFDSLPLARVLAASGARLALPAVAERDCALEFRAWTPGETLTPDALGVPAPSSGAPVVVPDLVVAPLLAFDQCGRRLGQGGGYYDRTLAELRAGGGVVALGLAYAAQEIDDLADEAHDQRLDGVLTEESLRLFSDEAG